MNGISNVKVNDEGLFEYCYVHKKSFIFCARLASCQLYFSMHMTLITINCRNFSFAMTWWIKIKTDYIFPLTAVLKLQTNLPFPSSHKHTFTTLNIILPQLP